MTPREKEDLLYWTAELFDPRYAERGDRVEALLRREMAARRSAAVVLGSSERGRVPDCADLGRVRDVLFAAGWYVEIDDEFLLVPTEQSFRYGAPFLRVERHPVVSTLVRHDAIRLASDFGLVRPSELRPGMVVMSRGPEWARLEWDVLTLSGCGLRGSEKLHPLAVLVDGEHWSLAVEHEQGVRELHLHALPSELVIESVAR